MTDLETMPEVILLDDALIRRHLSDAGTCQSALADIHVFPALGSTNEWLLDNGACGDVCLAEMQSAGRGRRGKVWQSPPNQNIYFSLRWCFKETPAYYGSLSLVVGMVVAEALQQLGLQGHGLKWPNDIYHNGCKLGGILLQTANPVQEVVIGIGLNVNMRNDTSIADAIDQPWCSLVEILGKIVDRNQLVALLLAALLPALQRFPNLDRRDFAAQWRQWDILEGQALTVHTQAKPLLGTGMGIDEQGQLLVLLDSGEQRAFSAGEVSIRL